MARTRHLTKSVSGSGSPATGVICLLNGED